LANILKPKLAIGVGEKQKLQLIQPISTKNKISGPPTRRHQGDTGESRCEPFEAGTPQGMDLHHQY
jgi:hypothetical protein